MKKTISLLTIDITLKGGIERVICNKANSLVEEFNIEIISFFKSNDDIAYSVDSNVNIIYLQKNIAFKHISYKFWLLFSIIKHRNFFYNLNVDKIVIMSPIISILLINLFPKHSNKIIASEHSEYFSQGLLLRFLRRLSYKKVGKIITLTNSGKDNFAKAGLFAEVIPNCVTDFPTMKQWSPKCKIESTTFCLFAGRFEPVKQVNHVLQVALQSISNNNIRFHILGDGPEQDVILNFANKFKLNNVFFHGNVSNIHEFYEKNHILLLTSITEAFPMVVLEAMSFGCVVICYDSQIGSCEIITNELDGFIIPAGNIQILYEKILFLSTNFEIFESMSREAIVTSSKYKKISIMKLWSNLLVE